ncbi:hypothetical protein BZA77DRAFT_154978 [Pyronema omphalodes]|nr:hypothetical protein BZA77DRAFT_154978 [Pyronema omphalodes]
MRLPILLSLRSAPFLVLLHVSLYSPFFLHFTFPHPHPRFPLPSFSLRRLLSLHSSTSRILYHHRDSEYTTYYPPSAFLPHFVS